MLKRYAQFSSLVNVAPGVVQQTGLPFVDMMYDGRIVYHTVDMSEKGRLDLISYKYLKDPSQWPLLAYFNSIIDPISDVKPGLQIAIPVDPINLISDFRPVTYSGVV